MANAEAPISFTTKLNGDLFTVRGDNVAEFVSNLKDVVNDEQLVDLIGDLQALAGTAPAVAAVKGSAGGTVTSVSSSSGPETVTDKYDNRFTYNHPEAPEIVPGVTAVLKEWTSQNGRDLRAWKHPITGPKPFPKDAGGDPKFNQWAD